MWRTQAVERMLLEDVAALRRIEGESEAGAALRAARRSAWRAVVVDWAAIGILLVVRGNEATAALAITPTVDTIFALGLLAVAVHSGFRLGQLEKLRAVALLLDELAQRR